MNRRLGLWLSLTLLLFTAACSSGSSSARPPSTPAPTSRAPVPPTTQPAVPPTTQAAEPVGPDGVPAPQSWLGIIDDRGSVVAVTPDGGQRLTFSPPADVGRGISSSIPSWSHDGSRLAWTETNRAEGPSVVTSRVDRRETTRDPLPLEPFYVSWNPTDTHIAVLGHSATGRGVGVAVSELADRNTLPVELDAAPSYYLSWAADGEQFLAKRGIADLTVVGIGGRSTVLVEPTGRGQAPIWLEDGRLIGIEATDRSRALVIASSGQVIGSVLETDPAVGMVFTADPTGRWLAIQALAAESLLDPAKDAIRSSDGSEPEGELLIVDLSNGRPVWRTGVRGQSWVWAPDGQSLLILTTEGPNDEGPLIVDSVIWHLPAPGSGEEPDLISGPSFEPTDRFVQEWMPFFDQYVQDMTLWSPDSSGWTFAGRPVGDREGQPGIHVVGAGPGDEPVRVGDGQMSVWAPTAGGGGGAAPSPA